MIRNKLINKFFALIIVPALIFLIGCTLKEEDITPHITDVAGLNINWYFRIVNVDSNKYLDGRNFIVDNAKLFQWAHSTRDSQRWKLVPSNQDGYVYIMNMSTDKVISLNISSNEFIQMEINQKEEQMFSIEAVEEGFKIKNKGGMYMDSQGRKNDGSVIFANEENDKESQLWRVEEEKVFDRLSAKYIVSKSSDEILGIPNIDYDTEVEFVQEKESFNNMWFIIEDNSMFKIKNIYSSKVLAAVNGRIVVSGNSDDENKLWIIEEIEEGYFIIKNKHTQKVLTTAEDKLTLEDENSTVEQLFKITAVNPYYSVPEPKPVDTGDFLIGVQTCNLWDVNTRPYAWRHIEPFPDRVPFLGFYDEGSPKTVDWEIKAAVDNGINLFYVLWYRPIGNVGQPVVPLYDHWIEGMKKSRYKDSIQYMIMFTNNQDDPIGNFQDEDDLLNNLMPFWIENYFKDPNYLTIDGKPVFVIYNSTTFINALGGVDNARDAVIKMREMVVNAGFEGLVLYGQFCWGDPSTNHDKLKYIGFEAVTSYAIPTFANGALPADKLTYTDEEILNGHKFYWERQLSSSLIPYIPTVSMGFDSEPWNNSVSPRKWRLTPEGYENVLSSVMDFQENREGNSFIERFILLDAWNEYGEGHYINPAEQYGFGYLEAVRKVFENRP